MLMGSGIKIAPPHGRTVKEKNEYQGNKLVR